MQFEGGYRYPGLLICTCLSLIFLSIAAFVWKAHGLSLLQGLALTSTLEGTVLWACSLTPKGLVPPPSGVFPKIRWVFEEQGGTPLSLNQSMFFLGIIFVLAGTILGALSTSDPMTRQSTARTKEQATMREVETALGKPDRIERKEGGIADGYESPTVIKWYYERFPVLASGEDYGKPGHINFVPIRFIDQSSSTMEADKLAREFKVEASDSYRAVSYSGSFPVDRAQWKSGDLDWIPIKPAGKR